ncbi:radical SAM family RiPP maturation amino acid epimerase [Anaerosporobacter sp.]|uniref:radical SAM family RiPP maturation amino acid epimerase n=1 Tax=Anaerosporobacter sp. TaxID=1872529 RepID=UPI00286F21D1|nr:radical SAM family RiPP maturation amino acid epimerase [Anaerosporobacter sp.]
MNSIEAKRINFDYDEDIIHQISHIKRFLELWTIVPGFQEKSKEELEEAIKEYNLDVSLEEIRVLYDNEYYIEQKKNGSPLSDAAVNYQKFITDKIMHRAYLQTAGCVPKNRKFARWRRMQVNRCWLKLGERNASMVHAPIIFELTDGCSVGCTFCGLNAGKLKGCYENSSENMKLWKEILHVVKEVLGEAGATGTCYYATEPFDNSAYEEFSQEFYNILGLVPQVTTTAAMRNPERMRRFLDRVREHEFKIHRFSVLDLKKFFDILEYFTPEELLFVELLPQFKEAVSNKFSITGREFLQTNGTAELYNNETICCISGFVVNMVRKQIRLVTPCITDAKHPTGEMVWDERVFNDSASFALCLEAMIKDNMSKELNTKAPLRFKNNVVYDLSTDTYKIKQENGYRTILEHINKETENTFHYVGRSVLNEKISADQLAEDLLEKQKIAPEQSYFIINKLFEAGILENGNYELV